jgi:hypothetical protein
MRVIYDNPVTYSEYRDEKNKIYFNINAELHSKKDGFNKIIYVVIPLYFLV